jgi:hypothetical protein
MVTVNIDNDDFLDMLVNRLESFWKVDSDVSELFAKYWEDMIDGGCFDGCDFNVMQIVDNDYVNNTSICYSKDDLYAQFEIEDEDDERILARHNGIYLVNPYW